MTARGRLRVLALVLAVAATGLAEVVLPTAAHAVRAGDTTQVAIPAGTCCVFNESFVTGPDGNFWTVDGSNVNRLTPAGVVTQFPDASGPSALTAGSDGNLWFINQDRTSPVVGRVTPTGTITDFPVPTTGQQRLRSITAGSDGNIWILFRSARLFGTFNEAMIAKVTPTGTITQYPIYNGGGAQFEQIVTGPNGRLYWIQSSEIDSVDPSNPVGTLVRTSFPSSGTAKSLAPGSDGNIWFAIGGGTSARAIGRMTPSGAITEFPLTSIQDAGFQTPSILTLGPDGNIWFNGDGSTRNLISNIDVDGHVKSYDLGPSVDFGVQAITAGPDGRVWFIDHGASVLGSVTPGDLSTTVLNKVTGFSNNHIRLAGPGSTLKFIFTGPTAATAKDTTGLDLFNTGLQSFTSIFPFTYSAAGTYTYEDTLQPAHAGTVDVPPTATPTHLVTGGNFVVQWASGPPAAGFVYDVQRQDPGGAFGDYIIGTTDASSLEDPFSPAGTYAYRARLRRTSDDAASGYSPEVRVHYGQGATDITGDIKTDISVFRPSEGNWYVKPSPSSVNTFDVFSGGVQYGAAGDIPVPGDYDGDGKSEVAIFRPSTGLWAIHNLGSFFSPDDDVDTFVTYGGVPGDVPIPADYDGDGKTDLAIYRPDFGTWWVHKSSDDSDVATTFGVPGDVAVPGGDFDGDGKADLAIFRDGTWFVHQSSDSADIAVGYGIPGDVPIPGDYDGDGKTDVAVYRPSEGIFYVHNSTAPDGATGFYASTDIPAPGDYDGDGRTDIAVFRPSNGNWYVHASGGGPDTVTQWGASGDIPLPLAGALQQQFYP